MATELGIEDIFDVEIPEEPVLSPDSKYVAYSLQTVNRALDKDEYALWVLNIETGKSSCFFEGESNRTPVWSPDSKKFAWVRNLETGGEIWVAAPNFPASAVRVAQMELPISNLRWSPDGKYLAFLALTDLASDLEQTSTVGTSAPVIIESFGYKADGLGLFGTLRNQPHILQLLGKSSLTAERVVKNDWNYTSLEWRPDSQALLVTAAGEANSDLKMLSSVYEVSLHSDDFDELKHSADSKNGVRLLAFADGFAAHAKWLSDGSAMLITGQENPGIGHLHLYIVNQTGVVERNLSAGLDRTVQLGGDIFPGSFPQEVVCNQDPKVGKSSGKQKILFSVNEAGIPVLCEAEIDTGKASIVLGGPNRSYVQANGSSKYLAAVIKTPTSFGEVLVLDYSGSEIAKTSHGENFWRNRTFHESEEYEFVLKSGGTVPGWLIRDPEATEPSPLLVDIHGGPHGSWNSLAVASHWYRNVLVAKGWAVLLLNPPASEGYGEEYFTENIASWGHGDQSAFLEPIDLLVAEGKVNDSKVVVAGYSYGGYSVCWLTTQTNRFAAAIAGGIVSDVTSLGSSDVAYPELYLDLGGSPWENTHVFDAQSPIRFVGNVKTPTLILHGAADDRCPVNQAEQWFTALHARKVPCQMVLYPGASHLMILNGKPSHREDYQRRIIDWATHFTGS